MLVVAEVVGQSKLYAKTTCCDFRPIEECRVTSA